MNEIAPTATLVASPRNDMATGGAVKAIIPQSFDEAWRLAAAIHKAGMTPEGLKTPETIMIAIMAGAEAGLAPMASIQGIMIVNNRPAIWGDAALALVRGSGICEWIRESFEGEGDASTAVCSIQRKGEPEPIERRFSVSDAKAANLWTKSGPWKTYPKRMMQMRARAWALRDGFADVLKGLHIAEEAQDIPTERETRVAPPAPSASDIPALSPPSAPTRPAPPKPVSAEVAQIIENSPQRPADVPEVDPDLAINLAKKLEEATKDSDLEELWQQEIEPHFDKLVAEDQEFLQSKMREATMRLAP